MGKNKTEKKKWVKPDFQSLQFKQTLGGNIPGVNESASTSWGGHGTTS